jgi:hypothetical protein
MPCLSNALQSCVLCCMLHAALPSPHALSSLSGVAGLVLLQHAACITLPPSPAALLQVLPPSSTVAQLLQQLPGSTGGGVSPGGPTRATPVIAVRHSMDAVGGNRSYLNGPTRSLNTLSGLPRCGSAAALPCCCYVHLAAAAPRSLVDRSCT